MPLFGQTPTAWRYDGRSRDLATEANGTAKLCHPVDQMMMIGVCTRRGSLKATPEIGTDVPNIQYLGLPNLQAEVEQRVRAGEPIATLLANGDVSIERVEVETTTHGGLKFSVTYKNLRLDRNRIQRVANF